MDSSQDSYEAPGPSYKGPDGRPVEQPTIASPGGETDPSSTPVSVPSYAADPAQAGDPGALPLFPPPPGAPAFPGMGDDFGAQVPIPQAAPPYPAYPVQPAPPVYGGGYPTYGGGYGPPSNTPGYAFPYYGLPAPRVVRHTLQRRTWMWVVGITALVAALVGGFVGALVGS